MLLFMRQPNNWQQANPEVFWGEIAPCEHVIQVYENDDIFLDTLAKFAAVGIKSGECVIIIATQNHLQSLYFRLARYTINLQELIADEQYIPLEAEKTLDQFMVNGWPDEELFEQTISAIIERGSCKNRRIRVFGEMVALLWGKGKTGATVQLEHLWNRLCEQNELTLFCAYPKVGFTNDINNSMQTLCECHSKIIDGSEITPIGVLYSEVKSHGRA
jgi:hypothetical protein